MTDREEKRYDLFIGKLKNGGYNFLEYAFKHWDGFKGLVWYELEFLTEEMLDERWDNYDWEDLRREAVHAWGTELGLDDWVDNVERWDGKESILDNSYWYKGWVENVMKEASERDGVEYEYTDCIWWWRHFSKEYNVNTEDYEWYIPENLELLQKLYKEYEEK